MANYAFLDANNIVTGVIVGVDENELIEGLDPETWYSQFKGKPCKRTSYNTHGGINENGTAFRKNYASVGFSYDEQIDAFIPPKPGDNYEINPDTGLWDKKKTITVLGEPFIIADGVSSVEIKIDGAANSSESVMVNNDSIVVEIDESGAGQFSLSSETAGLISISWAGVSVKVVAYDN